MKAIRRSEWADLIFFLAVLVGVFMRFNPTLLAGFAINDGGMFAVMVDDLKANHYLLPAFTSYNHLEIPFAYPPLGFYLGAIASDLLDWTAPQTLRWLPALFASLSIPAFYLLAQRLLRDKFLAAVSTLFFALVPRALFWYVMGGGLTRSPGQFFMLLALASVVRLYQENRRSDILPAGLFAGLAVLSHPEAAVHTFVSALFLWILLSRRWIGFRNSMLVGLIVLAVSAPWWVTVLYDHGIDPLLRGAATGQKTLAVLHLLFFTFTEEPYATVIAVLGLVGIAYKLFHKEYLLPLWMALPFFVEGRSAPGLAAIPLAMLAAIGLVQVVFAGLGVLHSKGFSAQPGEGTELGAKKDDSILRAERNILIYLLFYLMFSAYQFGVGLSSATLHAPDLEAMNWVRENTAPSSRFLVLTGTSSVSCDSVLEWFPAITGRQSILTIQGTEWTQGENFNNYVVSTYGVQKCLAGGDASCLDAAVSRSAYDYIYISKILRADNCSPLALPRTFPFFVKQMQANSGFQMLYETAWVIILEK